MSFINLLESNHVSRVIAWFVSVQRIQEHLVSNAIDFEKTPLRLGPWLDVDAKSERIIHCDGGAEVCAAANKLVRGKYRKPFVVPENV